MLNRRLTAVPVIVGLVLLLVGDVKTNSGAGNNTTESEGGIQLAKWDFAEFELFFGAFAIIILMCLFKTFYPKIPYVPDYIPQSLLLICIGVIFGLIFYYASDVAIEETLWKLTPTMFFHFLLPPIVLDAAFGLYNRTFIDYLASILIYAVIGTVLNFVIIGPLMYGLCKGGAMGDGLANVSLNSFFLFASLIVAVDPVAVLAIFQDIGVEPGLYYMVFGESLLNDAVTVVLYDIMRMKLYCPSCGEAFASPYRRRLEGGTGGKQREKSSAQRGTGLTTCYHPTLITCPTMHYRPVQAARVMRSIKPLAVISVLPYRPVQPKSHSAYYPSLEATV